MNRAYIWLSMPVVFLGLLYLAVMQTPDFIQVNFVWLWFVMVLVIMVASLGLLFQGLSQKDEPAKKPSKGKGDHGDEGQKAAH